jgi:flagellar hook assembly protein FlgD
LVKDSKIKILTISGRLVRQFETPGGRVAYWDGRDDSGRLVASGIYLIVAYDTEGNNVTTGKVAVLRQ